MLQLQDKVYMLSVEVGKIFSIQFQSVLSALVGTGNLLPFSITFIHPFLCYSHFLLLKLLVVPGGSDLHLTPLLHMPLM